MYLIDYAPSNITYNYGRVTWFEHVWSYSSI